jgi:hypothetical protein
MACADLTRQIGWVCAVTCYVTAPSNPGYETLMHRRSAQNRITLHTCAVAQGKP